MNSPERQWNQYSQQLLERIASCDDYDSDDLGPQLLGVRTDARGNIRHLVNLVGSRGSVSTSGPLTDIEDSTARNAIIRRGLAEGLTPQELFACTFGARIGLAQTAMECATAGYGVRQAGRTKGFNVLARAMRAENPGIVFAQAAANGKVDPLTDVDSRLFVGLPPTD